VYLCNAKIPHGNGNPPPNAFSTTTTEIIDYSIGFGFATLSYIVLEISRILYVDFIIFHLEITVLPIFARIFARPM
jgi:hypothetical protein